MRRRAWLLLLVFVVFMSLLPARFVPEWGHGAGLHFLAYATLVALALAALRSLRVACFAVAAALFISIGLEYAQLLVPGRSFELEDMVASTAGLLAGALVGTILRRRRRPASLINEVTPESRTG